MSSPRNIVAFVGQNENGILRQYSHDLMALLAPDGYVGHTIDLHTPNGLQKLNDLFPQGIAMAWGCAGVGSGLRHNDQILWDIAKIPFISVLADPPCWMPVHHFMPSRYVANAYVFKEWLQVQRRLVGSPQYSAVLDAVGVPPNPHRDDIAWRDRSQRMAFIKTAGDPQARRQKWANFPSRWRAILEDAAASAVVCETGDITDIFLAAYKSHGLCPDHRKDILFGLMCELDLYVREHRMTAFATALLDLPVDIYGRGWDHLAHKATRARFHPAFDAMTLNRVYANTQFILNTSPNIASNVHERVASGLDSRCCVISDHNAFTRQHMADIPTFFGVDPNSPDLADQMAALYHSPTDYTEATRIGASYAARTFDGRAYMLAMLKIAEEIKTAEHFHASIPKELVFV